MPVASTPAAYRHESKAPRALCQTSAAQLAQKGGLVTAVHGGALRDMRIARGRVKSSLSVSPG